MKRYILLNFVKRVYTFDRENRHSSVQIEPRSKTILWGCLEGCVKTVCQKQKGKQYMGRNLHYNRQPADNLLFECLRAFQLNKRNCFINIEV